MSTKPYCGMRKPPKGRTRGTAQECLKNRQVRYYGVNQIEKDIIDKFNQAKKEARKAASEANKAAKKVDTAVKKVDTAAKKVDTAAKKVATAAKKVDTGAKKARGRPKKK